MAADADPWMLNASEKNELSSEIPPEFNENFQPFLKLPDSEDYLNRLENHIAKLKGTGKELTGRKMLRDIDSGKRDHMAIFLQNGSPHPDDVALSTLEIECMRLSDLPNSRELFSPLFARLKLFPERQACTAEELQSLVASDQLAQVNQLREQLEAGKGDLNESALNPDNDKVDN